MLTEYKDKTEPLLADGGVYVSHEAVQKSEDKLGALKSALDQARATFEDYYGCAQARMPPFPSPSPVPSRLLLRAFPGIEIEQ